MEPPEPLTPLASQALETRVERGATRQVRAVEGPVFGWTVSVDRAGNAFVSLAYERSGVELGGGALPGDAGLALAKYAPDGTHVWSLGFPTYHGARPRVSAMVADGAGNLYIAGEHREPTLSLGGEPLPPGPFLAKYGPDGTHVWSRTTGFPGVQLLPAGALAVDERRGQLVVAVDFLDKGQPLGAALVGRVQAEDGRVLVLSPVVRRGQLSVKSLALEPSGHISLAGYFVGEVDLGGGVLSTTKARSPFVARFTPEMRHVWSRGLGEAEGTATGVAVEPKRVLVVGEYTGSIAFRGRAEWAEGKDGFVAAYAPTGGELWMRHFGESATGVAVDEENRVVVTGQYRPGDSVGGPRLPWREGGTPDNHLYVVKLYRGSGGHEWSRGLVSEGELRAGGLAVTRKGEAVLLPGVEGAADVGHGPRTVPPDSALLLRLVR
ncbi:hypothetical protein [Archangium gephyra]|uniref:Cell surface protein n=1 Tax=Archangium gephyra TaxID=48 RepID=A0AAC8TAW3_9BACT|nr:hypothetical protein [Archangium gephyra]AKI99022.1 cell surface protein [Archangium gephyra]